MLIRHAQLDAFEEDHIKKDPPDYERNVRIFEALYEEACTLGIFPLNDPLEGLEVDLSLAKALNVRTTPRKDRTGAR